MNPWLKFYPSDWRADPALRMCQLGARGLWMEMLCVMHEATPRGFLLVNGQTVNDRQLASLAGCSVKEATTWVAELEVAGVFSRDENGVIYSRRMRKDDEKAARDKANGSSGGSPLLKGGVNPPVNGQDKAHIPEARSQKELIKNGSEFSRESEASSPFPEDGSIAFSEGPWADIARRRGRGADVDVLAQAFRSFCREHEIDFASPGIVRKFETFCGKHRIRGLHA